MDWFAELYEDVKQRKLELESSVNDIRTLFKPWPSKTVTEEYTENKKQPSSVGSSTSVEKIEEPVLSHEELQSVNMVDQLLRKAQKAIDIQKKLEEPKRPKPGNTLTKQEKTKDLQENSKPIPRGKVKEDGKQFEQTKKQTSISTTNMSQQKLTGIKNKGTISNDKKETVSKPSTKGTEARRPNSGSGHKRARGVHVNAPFQTNPHLANTKLQTTYRASTTQVTKGRGKPGFISQGRVGNSQGRVGNSANSSRARGGAANTGGSETKIMTVVETNEKTRPEQAVGENSELMCKTIEYNSKSQSGGDDKTLCDTKVDCDNRVDEITRQVEEILTSDNKLSNSDTSSQQLFHLAHDGNTLKVPVSLKRQVHQNRKLHEKLFTEHVTTKVNSPLIKDEFAGLLQHKFSDPTVLYTQHNARQCDQVLTVITHLCDLLNSLHLDTLSEESSPADILRAKKILEYILLQYHEIEDKFHSIDLSILTVDNLYRGPFQASVLPQTRVASPAFWYKTDCLPYCAQHQQSYKYTRSRQLELHTRLVYDIQLRQLDLDLMNVMYKLVMPHLRSLDPTSSEFIQVLRLAYSMLSTHPNHVPVVVKDTIED